MSVSGDDKQEKEHRSSFNALHARPTVWKLGGLAFLQIMLVNRIVVDLWQGCRRNVKIERFISLHLIGTLIIASPPQSRSHVQTEACGAERPFRSGKEHAAEEADEGARGRLRLQRVAYVCGGPCLTGVLSQEEVGRLARRRELC